MLAQFVEDLVHLERREQGLDQHRRPNRAPRHAELALRHHEHVVPQPRFEVAFEFRQVEIRPAAAGEQFLRVVEEIEREVEDATGNRLAVDQNMFLGQVPASRTHEEDGGLFVQPVGLAFRRRVVDPAADRIAQIDVALEVVVPLRRVRVLEVGHEHARAGVERIDDHLAVDRSGDLDAAIHDVGRDRCAGPVAFADRTRLGEEIRQGSRVEFSLAPRPACQQFRASATECALQLGRERDGFGCQDLRIFGGDAAGDFDAGPELGRAHRGFSLRNRGKRGRLPLVPIRPCWNGARFRILADIAVQRETARYVDPPSGAASSGNSRSANAAAGGCLQVQPSPGSPGSRVTVRFHDIDIRGRGPR